MTISLIISTYNWPQALELCILSALNQSIRPDEIIIADDGSGQETAALISKFLNHKKIQITFEQFGFFYKHIEN